MNQARHDGLGVLYKVEGIGDDWTQAKVISNRHVKKRMSYFFLNGEQLIFYQGVPVDQARINGTGEATAAPALTNIYDMDDQFI